MVGFNSLDSTSLDYKNIINDIPQTPHNHPVVASLYSNSSTPSPRSGSSSGFSSISLSPSGDCSHGVAAGKDVLHILRLSNNVKDSGSNRSSRLEEIKSVRISQHLQTVMQTVNAATGGQNPQYPHLRDALRLPGASSTSTLPNPSTAGGMNVNITDVAWSLNQSYVLDNGLLNSKARDLTGVTYEEIIANEHDSQYFSNNNNNNDQHYPHFIKRRFIGNSGGEEQSNHPSLIDDTSVVAAAGSNGVITAWSAHTLLSSPDPSTSNNSSSGTGPSGLFYTRKHSVGDRSQVSSAASIGQPEATFLAHSRAVNRLAWHSSGRRPYLLLSASQDGTVKLWDRRATSSSSSLPGGVGNGASRISASSTNAKSWFGFGTTPTVDNTQMKSVLNRTATWHCVSTYAPKCEGVKDISWNPFMDDLFAMVAGEWLCVYDIRINKPLIKESTHAGDCTCVDWHPTRKYTLATGGGRDRSVKVWDLESGLSIHKQNDASMNNIISNAGSYRSDNSETLSATSHTSASSEGPINSPLTEIGRNHPHSNQTTLSLQSNLSTGSNSPVKRSASGVFSRHHKKKQLPLHVLNIAAPVTRIKWRPVEDTSDESLIAVATASIYGANAGGKGNIGLWSTKSPWMPMSVCEGHMEGAVLSFAWVKEEGKKQPRNEHSFGEEKWKTVITVGRDGQCLLQDFSYGHHPIFDVPRGCVAIANLTAFQKGFGSLQIMSVHQNINAGVSEGASNLVLAIADQGDVHDLTKSQPSSTVQIAPELTHLSRFSELYITKIGSDYTTRADLCRHNANVANGLAQKSITRMWKTLATILDGSELDGLPSSLSDTHSNSIANLLKPTLRKLLIQRADAGDVQSCVALCEVMDIICPPTSAGGSAKSSLPNLDISLIREWYLSYIDLLQHMCLFTQAAALIKTCKDPVINALNQNSTTIHESCPRCGKPLLGGTAAVQDDTGSSPQLSTQRVCRSCRARIGHCFLCHEPVKGIYVWCQACGHGGHHNCAIQWFKYHEQCPTGCGHKCNLHSNLFEKQSTN